MYELTIVPVVFALHLFYSNFMISSTSFDVFDNPCDPVVNARAH